MTMLPLPLRSLAKPSMPAAPNFSPTVSTCQASFDETRSFTAMTGMPARFAAAIGALRAVERVRVEHDRVDLLGDHAVEGRDLRGDARARIVITSFLILPLTWGARRRP